MGVYKLYAMVYNWAMLNGAKTNWQQHNPRCIILVRRRTADSGSDRRPQEYTKKVKTLPVSEAQKRATKKWTKANIKRFSIDLRKEIFEEFEAERKKRDMSRAEVIIDWLSRIHTDTQNR